MGYLNDLKARVAPGRIRTYLGGKIESARNIIYRLGYSIASRAVETLLKPESVVPTLVSLFVSGSPESVHLTLWCPNQNAFAETLGKHGFDVFSMLVVDLMHEFELGVWRAIFTHIIRVLYAATPDGSKVAEFNARCVYFAHDCFCSSTQSQVSSSPYFRLRYHS